MDITLLKAFTGLAEVVLLLFPANCRGVSSAQNCRREPVPCVSVAFSFQMNVWHPLQWRNNQTAVARFTNSPRGNYSEF